MKLQKRNVFHQKHKPDNPGPRRTSSQDCPGSGPHEPCDWSEPIRASPGRPPGFNAACYGPTGMHNPSSMAYDMACLIANKVCQDFLDPYRQPDPRATLLYDEYVAEVEQYEIDDFEPHPNACPQCEQQ